MTRSTPVEAFDAVDVIRTKRDRGTLSTAQIDWLVDAYTRGYVADEQMAAFAMAVLLNGMQRDEIRDLTLAMIASGERMRFDGLGKRTVDKHSTGEWATRSRCRSCRWSPPSVSPCRSSRAAGSGHTGGTLDKLESIPGWRAELSNEEMLEQLRTVGG